MSICNLNDSRSPNPSGSEFIKFVDRMGSCFSSLCQRIAQWARNFFCGTQQIEIELATPDITAEKFDWMLNDNLSADDATFASTYCMSEGLKTLGLLQKGSVQPKEQLYARVRDCIAVLEKQRNYADVSLGFAIRAALSSFKAALLLQEDGSLVMQSPPLLSTD